MLLSLIDEKKRWIRWLIGVLLIPVFLLKFLFETLVGVFIFSCLLYALLPHITGVDPWNAPQLLLWFDELGNDAKIGLATSLVTVLGFFVALHMTMHSWKRQTTATMRMGAADAIDRVIAEINFIVLQIQLFTELLSREVAQVMQKRIPIEAAQILSILSDDVKPFRANRLRFLQLQQELIALAPRYGVLFMPLPGMLSALEAVEEQVSAVSNKIWIAVPDGGTADPDHRRLLLERVNPTACRELAEACQAAYNQIARLQGGVRGALLSPVFELNATGIGRVIRQMFSRMDN